MYGFIHCVLGDLVVRGFGESTWQRIVKNAGIELGGGTFLMHKVYSDDDTWRLLNAISEHLEISREAVLESMGEHFVRYCIEYGFGSLLRVLGGSLKDFLCNLDSLHEHLASTYPGIRSPSFCCTEGPDDTLFLHYYSERSGLYPIVKGLVRMIAKEFFNVSVAVDVVSEERELTSCQGQVVTFSIRHLSCNGDPPGDEKRLSSGTICPTTSSDPKDLPLSVDTFNDIFPFHVMLDRDLKVVQMGRSLQRLLKGNVTSAELRFQDIFEIIRPKVESLFSDIVRHLNTIYVVRTVQGIINKGKDCTAQACEGASNSASVDLDESTLKLKGEMVFVTESDMLLFLCSPRVKDLSEFLRKGLYFSDTPLHDSSRDVLMVNYLRRRERDLLDKIEDVGNQLRKLQGKLSEDKRRTEELLHSILPSNAVQSLVSNSPVEAEAHPVVSILFSDIVNFTGICERVEPMDIVRMLNKLYTSFDVLSKLNELYKVETIGDAYMVAGGIPEKVDDHADRVVTMAVGMMDVSRTVTSPDGDKPISIRVGVHSGPCMAGVVGTTMPRYCLFGNTVSLASKMESCSQPGKINISDATKMCLHKGSYIFEENMSSSLPIRSYFVQASYRAPDSPVTPRSPLAASMGLFLTPQPSPCVTPETTPLQSPCLSRRNSELFDITAAVEVRHSI
ncbi:guanylate cyclase soluble subunit beta-1-like [Branchiostoma floridae]|uniref:guanylate cyclase n=1 Tax=Branchiostoma floridae TaxID=7739 RepID=A0A9J7LEZ7_BRAFL|nr:guanylate cyclase soluble subunit beta-1-like [Branchiostoma floridae]